MTKTKYYLKAYGCDRAPYHVSL